MGKKKASSGIPKSLKGIIGNVDQDDTEVDRLARATARMYKALRSQRIPAEFAQSLVAAWYAKKVGFRPMLQGDEFDEDDWE